MFILGQRMAQLFSNIDRSCAVIAKSNQLINRPKKQISTVHRTDKACEEKFDGVIIDTVSVDVQILEEESSDNEAPVQPVVDPLIY